MVFQRRLLAHHQKLFVPVRKVHTMTFICGAFLFFLTKLCDVVENFSRHAENIAIYYKEEVDCINVSISYNTCH